MPTLLPLDPDQLLSTTRSVRKRLDLERPVDLEVIRECIDVATQAPTGGNNQGWHFLVVTDPDKKRPIAEWYREAFKAFYGDRDAVLGNLPAEDTSYVDTTRKVIDSADYLADHIADVPVWVIACIEGRTDGAPAVWQASQWGSLLPAVWSFQLAARARGLASCYTTLHLVKEKEAAELLGIPDHVMQGALVPVAHPLGGTDFKPGPRRDLDRIIHHETLVIDPELQRHAEAARGFMPPAEGRALYEAAASVSVDGALLEVGTYCGKSSVYVGAAARELGRVVFTVDHHRGSEENQPGWEWHEPDLVDPAVGKMDTLPHFRKTIHDAGLEDTVFAVVGDSPRVARAWATPLAFLFIDGGHGEEPARLDHDLWTPHVVPGGTFCIHDVFEDPADGGQAPYEQIYRPAVDSGLFEETKRVGSLRVLRRH